MSTWATNAPGSATYTRRPAGGGGLRCTTDGGRFLEDLKIALVNELATRNGVQGATRRVAPGEVRYDTALAWDEATLQALYGVLAASGAPSGVLAGVATDIAAGALSRGTLAAALAWHDTHSGATAPEFELPADAELPGLGATVPRSQGAATCAVLPVAPESDWGPVLGWGIAFVGIYAVGVLLLNGLKTGPAPRAERRARKRR